MMKNTWLLIVALVAVVLQPASGQERIQLNTPAFTEAGVSVFRVAELDMDWRYKTIRILVVEYTPATDTWGTKVFDVRYKNTEAQPTLATDLMKALNKANLSTRSLHQRILDRLLADGKLPAGTVTGTVP